MSATIASRIQANLDALALAEAESRALLRDFNVERSAEGRVNFDDRLTAAAALAAHPVVWERLDFPLIPRERIAFWLRGYSYRALAAIITERARRASAHWFHNPAGVIVLRSDGVLLQTHGFIWDVEALPDRFLADDVRIWYGRGFRETMGFAFLKRKYVRLRFRPFSADAWIQRHRSESDPVALLDRLETRIFAQIERAQAEVNGEVAKRASLMLAQPEILRLVDESGLPPSAAITSA